MDVGAMTVFLHTFTEREKIYNLCESLTGARFTTSYTRIGGLSRDLPPGWVEQCRKFLDEVVVNIDETETLLTRNRIFVDRTQGRRRDLRKRMAIDYGLTGPNLRGSGVDYDLRKAHPYLVYEQLEFDVPVGSVGRLLRPLSRPHGGDAPERAHSASVPRQTARRPGSTSDRQCRQKIVLPPKRSADEDGGIDSSVHPRDARASMRRRAKFISAQKIRRANSAFTSTAKAAARRTG